MTTHQTGRTIVAILQRIGDGWKILFGGTEQFINDCDGMRYLRTLLAKPGHEFTALELKQLLNAVDVKACPFAEGVTMRISQLQDAPPLLDARASAEYRRRLTELATELAEAQGFNDLGRVEMLRREEEFLLAEIQRSGWAHQVKTFSSAASKATVSVRRAIGRVIKKILGHHFSLGVHLDIAVCRGKRFSYRPDPLLPIAWKIQ